MMEGACRRCVSFPDLELTQGLLGTNWVTLSSPQTAGTGKTGWATKRLIANIHTLCVPTLMLQMAAGPDAKLSN